MSFEDIAHKIIGAKHYGTELIDFYSEIAGSPSMRRIGTMACPIHLRKADEEALLEYVRNNLPEEIDLT